MIRFLPRFFLAFLLFLSPKTNASCNTTLVRLVNFPIENKGEIIISGPQAKILAKNLSKIANLYATKAKTKEKGQIELEMHLTNVGLYSEMKRELEQLSLAATDASSQKGAKEKQVNFQYNREESTRRRERELRHWLPSDYRQEEAQKALFLIHKTLMEAGVSPQFGLKYYDWSAAQSNFSLTARAQVDKEGLGPETGEYGKKTVLQGSRGGKLKRLSLSQNLLKGLDWNVAVTMGPNRIENFSALLKRKQEIDGTLLLAEEKEQERRERERRMRENIHFEHTRQKIYNPPQLYEVYYEYYSANKTPWFRPLTPLEYFRKVTDPY